MGSRCSSLGPGRCRRARTIRARASIERGRSRSPVSSRNSAGPTRIRGSISRWPTPKGPRLWSVEMNPPPFLIRAGWKSSTLKAGDKVSVTLNPIRTGNRAASSCRSRSRMAACSASERLHRRRSPDDNSQPPTSQLPTLGIGDWKLGSARFCAAANSSSVRNRRSPNACRPTRHGSSPSQTCCADSLF